MQAAIYRRVSLSLLIAMSLVGVFSTLSHYFFRIPVDTALANHIGPSPAWFTDQLPLYDQHAIMTFIHLVPAAIFIFLAPFQLSRRLRQRFSIAHRVIGRSLLVLGLFLVVAGIIQGVVMPFAGMRETIVSQIIGAGFIFTGYMGFRAIRHNRVAVHRKWMSYMLAFAYTPMLMRIFLIVLTQGFGLDGQRIFAETMFASMLINLVIVYLWIQRKPRQAAVLNNEAAYDF